MTEKQFPEGISAYKPNPNAPEFIIADILVKKDFIAYFNTNSKHGEMRLQVKLSKGGKYYIDINDYQKPSTVPEVKKEIKEILSNEPETTSEGFDGEVINPDDIPF